MEKERNIRSPWKRFLNYHSVSKQLPFFLFLSALGVLYIYNVHYADRTIRNVIRSGRELKDLQSEYKSVKGEALLRSRQSEVLKAVQLTGLKEVSGEPIVLIDSSLHENN